MILIHIIQGGARRRWFRAGAILVCAAAATGPATAADRRADFDAHLRAVVEEGLLKRGSISQVTRHAAIARRLRPKDPAVDYACGLMYVKRLQYPRAAASYHKSLRADPTYLPAWRALFRMRLDRRDKALFADADKLALQAVNSKLTWDETGRRDAVVLLGRVFEFLLLPGVDVLPREDAKAHGARIEKRLGLKFEEPYHAGRAQVRREYDALQAEAEKAAIKRRLSDRKKADATIADIREQREDNTAKSQTLKKTAAQWKTWLDGRLKDFDKQITSLQKDYQTLQVADARVARLVQRTTIDIGRLKTEYRLRRLPDRIAATQPALLRLEQESMRYQNQRLQLQRRAAGVLTSVRRAIATRAASVAQYQQATGQLVQEDKRLKRWNKVLKNASVKVREGKRKTPPRKETRLTQPAAYFPVDVKAEADRLLGKTTKEN